ncbi:MAG: DUF86 domain-containing protein [Dehalococcoidia bacterium]|nr:DUF86 domain-containing protein [Dehalococcoidia bacterium]
MLRPELAVAPDAIAAVCRRYGIMRLSLFGSALREDFRPESDLDLLADFAPDAGLARFAAAEALSALFGRPVDLVDRQGLAPRLRAGILASERLLYERHPDGSETMLPVAIEELAPPMAKDERAYLEDMLAAAEELRAIVAGLDRAEFSSNRVVQLAVLHLIQTIGEAASKVSRETREAHPDIPWAAMIGMRNRIVHAYDRLDDDLVWQVAREQMPPLIASLRRLVANTEA